MRIFYILNCLCPVFITNVRARLSEELKKALSDVHTIALNKTELVTMHEKINAQEGIQKSLKLSSRRQATMETIERRFLDTHEVAFKDIGTINEEGGIGQLLYQSDIVLTRWQMEEIINDNRRRKRQAYRDLAYPMSIWPDGVVYFSFHDNFTHEMSEIFKKGAMEWQKDTCVNFVENPTAKERIEVLSDVGCYSYIGNIHRVQPLSLGTGCEAVGFAMHEIGHALGFFHTHARHDRDQYIFVDIEAVQKIYIRHFKKEPTSRNNNYGIPYDYGSVMQYNSRCFASDKSSEGRRSMVPVDEKYVDTLGSHFISFYDKLMMNIHYNCLGKCKTTSSEVARNSPLEQRSRELINYHPTSETLYRAPSRCRSFSSCRSSSSYRGSLYSRFDSPSSQISAGSSSHSSSDRFTSHTGTNSRSGGSTSHIRCTRFDSRNSRHGCQFVNAPFGSSFFGGSPGSSIFYGPGGWGFLGENFANFPSWFGWDLDWESPSSSKITSTTTTTTSITTTPTTTTTSTTTTPTTTTTSTTTTPTTTTTSTTTTPTTTTTSTTTTPTTTTTSTTTTPTTTTTSTTTTPTTTTTSTTTTPTTTTTSTTTTPTTTTTSTTTTPTTTTTSTTTTPTTTTTSTTTTPTTTTTSTTTTPTTTTTSTTTTPTTTTTSTTTTPITTTTSTTTTPTTTTTSTTTTPTTTTTSTTTTPTTTTTSTTTTPTTTTTSTTTTPTTTTTSTTTTPTTTTTSTTTTPTTTTTSTTTTPTTTTTTTTTTITNMPTTSTTTTETTTSSTTTTTTTTTTTSTTTTITPTVTSPLSGAAKCAMGGFPNPRDCSKCVCPEGYGGRFCDERPSGCGFTMLATTEVHRFDDNVGYVGVTESKEAKIDFMKCTYWIQAPQGRKIELVLAHYDDRVATDGCYFAGVEIKTQKDQRATGYRICSPAYRETVFRSESNIVPIITYSRIWPVEAVFLFRMVE